MNDKIKKWLKENSMIVVLLVLFFTIPYLLRSLDETSAAFDPGILHSIVLVCVVFSIFQACTWSIVKTIWPDIGQYLIQSFSDDYKVLKNNTRLLIALGLYFIILLCFVLLFIGVV